VVLSMASAVFAVAFICDTGGLTRLFWACLAGQVGQIACLAAFCVLLLLLYTLAVACYRPGQSQAVKVRKNAAGRPARGDDQKQRNRSSDSGPDETGSAAKRGSRKKSSAALNSSA
jgi:hypothetical protein